MRSWKVPFAALALLLAPAFSFAAVTQRASGDGSIPLPSAPFDPARAAQLDRGPAWQGFRARHGAWTAIWNTVTGSPHRAFGAGIPLTGFAPDPAAVDRAVQAFVLGHPDMFGAGPTLRLVGAEHVDGLWYVHYQQVVNGVPVMLSDWEFRVGDNGRLFMFGADVERPSAALPPATIVGAAARQAAEQGLAFQPATDRVEGGDELFTRICFSMRFCASERVKETIAPLVEE